MEIQGAIFDMDGTLGDTVFVSVEAIAQTVLQLTGNHHTHEEIISMFGPSEPGILRQLVPQHQWEDSLLIFLDLYESIHRQHQIGAFPGIEEILHLLKEHHIRQAIVTGKSRQSAEISLKYFNLNGYFDSIETGSIDGSAKKSRIQKVLRTWEFPPENVLYIGDAPSDVRIAKSAGLRPISVAWDSTANRSQLVQQNPDALFEQPQDLHNWLAAHLNGSSTS
jgi:phosphoglycolate phosphatase-like HAD superfamily hydrolase